MPVLFVLGLLFHEKGDYRKDSIVAGALIGFTAMYLLPGKNIRYYFPLSVFMTPVAVYWITVRRSTLLRIAGILAVSYISLIYGFFWMAVSTPLLIRPYERIGLNYFHGVWRDNTSNPYFQTRDILEVVKILRRTENPVIVRIYPCLSAEFPFVSINSIQNHLNLNDNKHYLCYTVGSQIIFKEQPFITQTFRNITGIDVPGETLQYSLNFPYERNEQDTLGESFEIIYIVTMPSKSAEETCNRIRETNARSEGIRHTLVRMGKNRNDNTPDGTSTFIIGNIKYPE